MRSRIPGYLFVKDPTRRPCKTRLAAGVGAAGARTFYEAVLTHLVARLGSPMEGVECVLYVDPPEALEDFPARIGWAGPAHPQPGGDLNGRLLHAFEDAGGAALVLGSDMPELGPTHLERAAAAVRAGRVALGPCPDGGYYLLGAPAIVPGLFEGMEYSTPRVFEETHARARAAGYEVEVLPEVADVDEAADLEALDGRLAGAGALGEVVRRVLAGAGEGDA